jgi:hypothetical protein
MELTGIVKKVTDVMTFASGFQKRELIILTQEQYPQPILIEFLQDKCDLLNNITENTEVKIGINIRGREWQSPQGETKYFNSIVGWRIENLSASQPTQSQPTSTQQPPTNENPFAGDDDDDLPF